MGEKSKKKRPRGKPFKPGDKRAGRPKGVLNKVTVEVKQAAQALVEDPDYRRTLALRLKKGRAAPAVEAMLWYYAYGKPKEMVELTGPNGTPLIPDPSDPANMTTKDRRARVAALLAKQVAAPVAGQDEGGPT
jgi:hypothetical protein